MQPQIERRALGRGGQTAGPGRTRYSILLQHAHIEILTVSLNICSLFASKKV